MRTSVLRNSTSCSKPMRPGMSYLLALAATLTVFSVAATSGGCGAGKIPPVKTYAEAKKEVKAKGPLVSPPIEEREGYEDGTSVVIKKGDQAPFKGIVVDAKKAARLAAIKAERDRRRRELQASREKAEIQRRIYESTILHLKAKVDSRNTWWERNKGLMGLTFGVTIGMAIVLGLVYGLTKGQGVTITTNPHALALPPRVRP